MSSDATDNTMRAELLPCPFCGAPGHTDPVSDTAWKCGCDLCDFELMSGPVGVGWWPTKTAATAAWNRRADTDRQVAEAVTAALTCTTEMAVAMELDMDNQVETSGLDSGLLHRQDGFRLWEAAIRARTTSAAGDNS